MGYFVALPTVATARSATPSGGATIYVGTQCLTLNVTGWAVVLEVADGEADHHGTRAELIAAIKERQSRVVCLVGLLSSLQPANLSVMDKLTLHRLTGSKDNILLPHPSQSWP